MGCCLGCFKGDDTNERERPGARLRIEGIENFHQQSASSDNPPAAESSNSIQEVGSPAGTTIKIQSSSYCTLLLQPFSDVEHHYVRLRSIKYITIV